MVSQISNFESTNLSKEYLLWIFFNWQTKQKTALNQQELCFLFQLLKLNKIREANWRKYLMNLILEMRPKISDICKNINSRRFWKTPKEEKPLLY